MKKLIFIFASSIFWLTSCEREKTFEIFFRIGENLKYEYSDLELYDTSTHILYFKRDHPEFENETTSPFSVLVDGQEIYQGSFVPGYSSSYPSGAMIQSGLGNAQNFALKIECGIPNSDKDLRNDPRINSALNEHNLLHSGLSIEIDTIECSNSHLIFSFTITNNDRSDLFILDPDKTGLNLFHYYTNGLAIYDFAHNEVFTNTIPYEAPSQWNGWEFTWLSQLKSGESRQFKIEYPINSPINPGTFNTSFTYPGLFRQVSRDQLYQDNIRIWLGNLSAKKVFALN